MEHVLQNAEVVVYYEIMNSNVPCTCIQADWYRPCNTNQRTTRAVFSLHDLEETITPPAGVGLFIF